MMKMRNLPLSFFILGLLAAVHSAPFNTATQIPEHPEEDLKEAETEGFIIHHAHLPLAKTESPKIKTTITPSQQPSLESTTEGGDEKSLITESIGADLTATLQSTSEATYEGSGESPSPTEFRGAKYTTTVLSTLEFTSEGSGESPSPTESRGTAYTTTVQSTSEFTSEGSGESPSPTGSRGAEYTTTAQSTLEATCEGSGESPLVTESPSGRPQTTDDSTSDSSTVHSVQSGFTSSLALNEAKESASTVAVGNIIQPRSGIILGRKPSQGDEEQVIISQAKPVKDTNNASTEEDNKNSTPEWIIILGFVAGLAALVLFSVAIATKDKWAGPKQFVKDVTKSNASNQTGEPEKQTFLHKQEPKESGKAEEYTVIPLEELPENFSSD